MTYQFDFFALLPFWRSFIDGVVATITIAAVATLGGFVIGLLLATMRTGRMRLAQLAAVSYIELVRNTPLLVQLFFVFFALPAAGLRMSPMAAGVLALVANCAAYSAEIIRAGILSVPKGHLEAGAALGLRPYQIFFLVMLKPALRTIYFPLCSQFILTLLATSIISAIGVDETTSMAQRIDSEIFRSFEVYFVAAILYWVMAESFSTFFRKVYDRLFDYPL